MSSRRRTCCITRTIDQGQDLRRRKKIMNETHPPIRELVSRWRTMANTLPRDKAQALYAAADDLCELLNVLDRRAVDHVTAINKGLPGEFSARVLNLE